jgi:hypothetical protein
MWDRDGWEGCEVRRDKNMRCDGIKKWGGMWGEDRRGTG